MMADGTIYTLFDQDRHLVGTDGQQKLVRKDGMLLHMLFMVAGTLVFAVGLWLHYNAKTRSFFEGELSSSVFVTGIHILIITGGLVMVVGFLGCCGAIRESQCMLGLFVFFLLVMFILKVTAGVWAVVNRDKVLQNIEKFYNNTHSDYSSKKTEMFNTTINIIHDALDCCGPDGSACPDKYVPNKTVNKTCHTAIRETFGYKLAVIATLALPLGILMVSSMVFSMMLIIAIWRQRM